MSIKQHSVQHFTRVAELVKNVRCVSYHPRSSLLRSKNYLRSSHSIWFASLMTNGGLVGIIETWMLRRFWAGTRLHPSKTLHIIQQTVSVLDLVKAYHKMPVALKDIPRQQFAHFGALQVYTDDLWPVQCGRNLLEIYPLCALKLWISVLSAWTTFWSYPSPSIWFNS